MLSSEFNLNTFLPVSYSEGRPVVSSDSVGLLTAKLFHAIQSDDIHNFDYYLDEVRRLKLSMKKYSEHRHFLLTASGEKVMITFLEFACKTGALKCAKRLLALGVNVDTQDHDKNSPLHLVEKFSPYNSKNRLIKLLLKNGANVHLENVEGITPQTFESVQKNKPFLERVFKTKVFRG